MMNIFTRISVLIAVIGVVGILNAMVDIMAMPSASSSINIEHNKRKISIDSQLTQASETDAPTGQIINNIYATHSPSFYFIQSQTSDPSQPSSDVYYQAPLLHSAFKVQVTGPIARTTVVQRFTNDSSEWADGIYVFPLPMGAAVDSLLMRVNGREIRGEIKAKEQAKKLFDQASAEGKKASLVTQLRPDIFKNQLTNIPPGEQIEIEIEYQQLLRHSQVGYELKIPTGITPKYQSDEGSTGSEEASAPVLRPIEIEIDLNMGMPLRHIESLYHEIQQTQDNSVQYYIKTESPLIEDKMFVLRWQLAEASHTQIAHIQQDFNNERYGMISLLAPQHTEVQLKRDVTFILDTSGSMVGDALIQAKSALIYAINDLAFVDRFNIVEFDSDANALWASASIASDANKIAATEFLQTLEADGGTEILGALELAFALQAHRPDEEDRLKQIVFITDGAVANETEIMQAIKLGMGNASLFTIGIGGAPNTYFMHEAAAVGRGIASFIGDLSLVESEMRTLLNKIKYPRLRNLQLSGFDNLDAPEIYPSKLPDLYAGEPLHIFYKVAHRDPVLDKLAFAADALTHGPFGAPKTERLQRKVTATIHQGGAGIHKQWGHEKIAAAMRQLNTSSLHAGDRLEFEANIKQQVVSTALAHQLVSPYTSLIAIDHETTEINEQRQKQSKAAQVQRLVALNTMPSTSADISFLRLLGLVIGMGAFALLAVAFTYAYRDGDIARLGVRVKR